MFGVLWYWHKGMFGKGLAIWFVGSVLGIMLFPLIGLASFLIGSFAIAVYCGYHGNEDYYVHWKQRRGVPKYEVMRAKIPATKESKKLTLGWALSWIFGVLFGLAGISHFGSLASVIFLLISFILLPPMNKFVKDEFEVELSRGLKIAIVVILMLVAGANIQTSSTASGTTTALSNPTSVPTRTVFSTITPGPTQTPTQTAHQTINVAISIQDVGKDTIGTYVSSPSLQITNTGPSDLMDMALDITLLKDGQIVKKNVGVYLISGSNLISSVPAGDSVVGTLQYMSPTDLNGHYTLKIDLRKGASITVIATDSKDFDMSPSQIMTAILGTATIATPTATLPITPTKTIYKFGDKVVFGDFAYTFLANWTIASLSYCGYTGYDYRDALGIFMVFELEIENVGNEPSYLANPPTILIVDGRGRQYERDSEIEKSCEFTVTSKPITKKLQPNLPQRVSIVFDVPIEVLQDANAVIDLTNNSLLSSEKKYVSWGG